MSDFPLLTTLIVLPLVGAIVTGYLPSRGVIARGVGLGSRWPRSCSPS